MVPPACLLLGLSNCSDGNVFVLRCVALRWTCLAVFGGLFLVLVVRRQPYAWILLLWIASASSFLSS